MSKSRQERRPTGAAGVPDEEGMTEADVEERVDLDPDEQLNRPDQPDMTEEERRQYDDPPTERSSSESDHPEGR